MNRMDRDRLNQWIEANTEAMVEDLRRLLRAESVESDPLPKAPFGQGVRDALDIVLDLGTRYGFRVKDFEGYAAHLELGEGEEMIASLSHVDVVPPGSGWTMPPFGAEIRDGYIYARGATDDKGATVAVIHAARALKELGVPLKRRIRLIIGCDEESGWECMRYYLEHEPERPVCGFSPDGGWPFIFGEKGIVNLFLEKPVPPADGTARIVMARGGERPNMVPDRAEALIARTQGQEYGGMEGWEEGIAVETQPEGLRVVAKGKAAHGSTPQEGVNAVARLLRALQKLGLPDNDLWLNTVLAWAESLDGAALGIAHSDEVSGALTANLGVFEHDGQKVQCVFNIRYPVTWTVDALLENLQPVLERTGFQLAEHRHTAPLYVPLETPFAQAILSVYRDETGDPKEPQTMGGGTYARVMPNLVAIGAGFESDGSAHEPDEHIAIASLPRLCRLYARILESLANLHS